MIYLIDDAQDGERNPYEKSINDDAYKGILRVIKHLTKDNALPFADDKDAVVLYHDSFKDSDENNKFLETTECLNIIKTCFRKNKFIPSLRFSGGITVNEFFLKPT